MMCRRGVACMAGRSLGARLGPLTILLLVLTGLTLSWENPDLRTPGDPEQGPPASGRWCGKCGRTLEEEASSSGPIYSCPIHGALDEEDICSPSQPVVPQMRLELELEQYPLAPPMAKSARRTF